MYFIGKNKYNHFSQLEAYLGLCLISTMELLSKNSSQFFEKKALSRVFDRVLFKFTNIVSKTASFLVSLLITLYRLHPKLWLERYFSRIFTCPSLKENFRTHNILEGYCSQIYPQMQSFSEYFSIFLTDQKMGRKKYVHRYIKKSKIYIILQKI